MLQTSPLVPRSLNTRGAAVSHKTPTTGVWFCAGSSPPAQSAQPVSTVLPSHSHPSPDIRGALPQTMWFIVGAEFGRAVKGTPRHSRNK